MSGTGSISSSSDVIANGRFDISQTSAGASITTLSGNGSVSLGLQTLTISNGSTTFSGTVSDGGINPAIGGSLTIAGGTQTLAGSNTYTGATTVTEGTLALSGTGSIATSSKVAIATAGTLDISQTSGGASITTLADTTVGQSGNVALGSQALTITKGSTTFSGVIADGGVGNGTGGSLTIAGGTQTLAGANSYTGGTTITGGTLALTGGGTLGATTNSIALNGSTAILDLGKTTQTENGGVTLGGGGTIQNGTLSSNSAFSMLSGTVSAVLAGTGALNKTTSGKVTLSGANTYDGGTTVSGGTLAISQDANLGQAGTALAFDNGTLQYLAGFTDSARGVTLTGANIFDTQTYSSTLSGVIGGAGSLSKIGTGTLTLSGVNTYQGGTNINGGTLAVTNDSSVGTGAVALNAGTLQNATKSVLGTSSPLTFGNNINLGSAGGTFDTIGGNLALSGKIADALVGTPGSLTVTGGNTLTLTGMETYTGATTINGGTLSILGDITSSSGVSVNSGGILSGIGFVPGVIVAKGGILQAGTGALALGTGNTPTAVQTLTITGNLVLQTASTYQVAINGSNYTTATLTGAASTATIQTGVTLKISGASLLLNTPYNLLTLTGSGKITGAFSLPPVVTPTTIYTANVTDPTGKQIDITFSNPQPNAPSGSVNSGGQFAAADMQTSFATTLLNPNVGGRGGSPAGGYGPALGFAPEAQLTPEEQAAYDAVTPHEPLDAMMRSLNTGYSHSVWASAYGGYSHVSGDSASGNSTANSGGGGIASGIDFRLGADTVLGFALGGGSTSWSLSAGQGSGTSDIFQAGIYGSHRFGDAYISGSLAYAFDAMNTKRNITTAPVANLTSSFNANGVTGRVEGGYRFSLPDVGITPYIAGEFSALHTPSYSETTASGASGFALSYASQTQTNERAEVGIWADKLFQIQENAIVRLGARAGYAHDWWSSTSFNAQFVSLPTQSFTMTGITPPSNLGLASLLAEVRYRSGVSLSAKFDAELGQNAYSLAGTGTFRYAW